MIITANIIEKSLRPQFVWDHKSTGKWLLANAGRDLYFQKDLGILVFINVAMIFNCPLEEVRFLVGSDDLNFMFYCGKLEVIQKEKAQSGFELWRLRQIKIKTGLVKNIITCNYGIKS